MKFLLLILAVFLVAGFDANRLEEGEERVALFSEDSEETQIADGEELVGDDWARTGYNAYRAGKFAWKYRNFPLGRRELQEESEDSEEELAVTDGEKPVGDGWARNGYRAGKFAWKYRKPISRAIFSRRRKWGRRELQEESEEEFSEDSEEMEIADGEDKVSDDIIFTGGIAAATLAYRNRNKIGRWERRTSKKIRSWFRRRSRNGFRRSLAVEEEEEVSDDDVIACFGMYKGNSPGECNKIKRVGRHVGGWFKRHGIRRRYVVPQNDPRFLFFHGRRRKVRYGKSFNVGRRRRRRYVGRKGGF